jgi:23S rRNA (cytidine2498-2'-O)-methyltransferase
MSQPRFYFSTCQVGAEKAVKSEIAKYHSELKFSFSRPGFITFKEDDDSKPLIKTPKSIFSRLWGVAVGQAKEKEAIKTLIESVPAASPLHVFSRDEFVPGDEREDYKRDARIFGLLKEFGIGRSNNQTPKLNETVYDLIWIDDLHVFLGKHENTTALDGSPGNIPKLVLPESSPSRAYLKIAEAVHRFKPEQHKGLQVLEVGCAPGGATSAMLSWGMNVVGVDPKRVDMRIQGNPQFQLIQKMAKDVTVTDLKAVNPEWLVLDMNLAPLETLDELAHVVEVLRKNFGRTLLLGKGFLTIKLNDWKFADSIPLYLARIQEIGFKNLTVTQLVSNRQEFFVMANGFE